VLPLADASHTVGLIILFDLSATAAFRRPAEQAFVVMQTCSSEYASVLQYERCKAAAKQCGVVRERVDVHGM
jgi:hypothetical protein